MNQKKIVAWFSIFVILCSALFGNAASAESALEGATFTSDHYYVAESGFTSLPTTYEATVYFPASMSASERGGVIIGNYSASGNACFNFEIHKNGSPRLYITDSKKQISDIIFDQINVYNGQWTHIAIVKNFGAGTVSCYINGTLKQTKNVSTPSSVYFSGNTAIGGDFRSANTQYFKGAIKNIAVYSDMRSASEIAKDSTGSFDAQALVGYYALTQNARKLVDQNRKGPTFVDAYPFLDDYESVTEYAYSFAVVGDTQTLTYYYPDKLHYVYDWIVENAEAKKIKFVFGLGDITDKNTAAEYNLAKDEIHKMDGIVPYSIVRGNHDKKAGYNTHFTYSEFGHTVDGSYEKNMLNTYQRLTVGDVKYLIVNLDIGPSDEVLAWANGIIAEHSDYNVIITTHIYQQLDGTTFDAGEGGNAVQNGGVNTGELMWEKLISQHENIVLVLCGHDPTDNIVVTKKAGVHGNTVTQMLVDPQRTDKNHGGVGLVAMLYFSEDGREVDVEYYSTVKNAHFLESNQFHLKLDLIGEPAPESPGNEETDSTESIPEESDTAQQTTAQLPDASGTTATPNETQPHSGVIVGITVGATVLCGGACALVILKKKMRR